MYRGYFYLLLSFSFLMGQTIDETLNQIKSLKKEIENNERLVEKKIADLRESNPLFAPQDAFESDEEYLSRMTQAMPQLDIIRKQYLDDLWIKMSILRGRLFETSNIDVTLDKDLYNPNDELWPLKVNHGDYQKENFDVTINITREVASALYKNKDNLQIVGVLSIDVGDVIGLSKLKIKDPISTFEFEHEFRPMMNFKGKWTPWSVEFSPDGKNLATSWSSIHSSDIIGGALIDLERRYYAKGWMSRSADSEDAVFSPDGKLIAIAQNDHIYIYNVDQGENGGLLNSFSCLATIDKIAWSPDGKFMVILYDGNRRPEIFNIENKVPVKKIENGRYETHDMDLSLDGKFLATSSYSGLYITDFKNNETFEMDNYREVYSVSISPNSKLIAFVHGGREWGLTIKDIETKKEMYYDTDFSSYSVVEFSPDGKHVAYSRGRYDYIIEIKNLITKEIVKKINVPDTPRDIAFSKDGKYIAVGAEGHVNVYRTLIQVEEDVLASKSISKPPSLSATMSFSEPSGNNFLDALETGKFTISIKNNGKGPGKGLLIKVNPSRIDNLNYNNVYIEEISPGKSVTVEIPVEAYINIKDANHTFRFEFEEVNGFPPNPLELQFSTKSYLMPEMYIADVGIEDADQNGKIEPGETVTLSVRIANKGKGTASNAYAKFFSEEHVFIADTYPKTVALGNLSYGNYIDVPIEFFVNQKVKEEIPLFVDITEQNNLANVSKLRIPITKSQRSKDISRTVITGIEADYGDLEVADLSIDIERDIPKITKTKKHSIAIVIGNKNYHHHDVPEVTFAHRDVAVMEQYLYKTLGFEEVYVEIDATQGRFYSLFGSEKKNGKLQDYIKDGKSDVFIYYSGHGAPDPENKDGYFVPVDCDPSMVDVNGYSLNLFYKKINKLKAKSVTVLIDACFSGSSEGGMLLKNISPVFIETNSRAIVDDNVTVFSSSSGDQVSSWYPEKKHSLFTYYFLKGLRGDANITKDKILTYEEMQFYLTDKVGYMARKLNSREQTPELQTNDERGVLIQY